MTTSQPPTFDTPIYNPANFGGSDGSDDVNLNGTYLKINAQTKANLNYGFDSKANSTVTGNLTVSGNVNATSYFKNGVEVNIPSGISSNATEEVVNITNQKTTLNSQLSINHQNAIDTNPPLEINSISYEEMIRLTAERTVGPLINDWGPVITFFGKDSVGSRKFGQIECVMNKSDRDCGEFLFKCSDINNVLKTTLEVTDDTVNVIGNLNVTGNLEASNNIKLYPLEYFSTNLKGEWVKLGTYTRSNFDGQKIKITINATRYFGALNVDMNNQITYIYLQMGSGTTSTTKPNINGYYYWMGDNSNIKQPSIIKVLSNNATPSLATEFSVYIKITDAPGRWFYSLEFFKEADTWTHSGALLETTDPLLSSLNTVEDSTNRLTLDFRFMIGDNALRHTLNNFLISVNDTNGVLQQAMLINDTFINLYKPIQSTQQIITPFINATSILTSLLEARNTNTASDTTLNTAIFRMSHTGVNTPTIGYGQDIIFRNNIETINYDLCKFLITQNDSTNRANGKFTIQNNFGSGLQDVITIKNNLIEIAKSMLPSGNTTIDLGSSSVGFRNLYATNLYSSPGGNLHLGSYGVIRMGITSGEIGVTLPIRPSSGNLLDLGASNLMWLTTHSNNINASSTLSLQTGGTNRMTLTTSAITSFSTIIPNSNSTLDIGNITTAFSTTYTRVLSSPNVVPSGNTNLILQQSGTNKIEIGSNNTISYNSFRASSNTLNLGDASNRWGTLFSLNAVDISSDSRKKNSIQRISLDCLDVIKNIDGKEYKLNEIENDDLRYGFIAEDFIQYLQNKNIDPLLLSLINQDDEGFYSMRYQELIGVLWNGVKQLNEENQILKNENQSLKDEIASLKSDIQNIKSHLNI